MHEEKIVNDEEAKALLMLNDSRYTAIKRIRHGSSEYNIGLIVASILVILALLLGQKNSFWSIGMPIIVALQGRQIWNERRFNALLDFLENEGLIKK